MTDEPTEGSNESAAGSSEGEGNEKRRFIELDQPAGRIYAIGDIHGCVDELGVLIEFLESGSGLTSDDVVIFIGDYIDRGPSSMQVIAKLLEWRDASKAQVFFLRGNHEDMLLGFLGFEGHMGSGYLANGGQSCLNSYGIDHAKDPKEILSQLPEPHVKFFQELQRYIIIGDFVFAHAGLNPLRDLRFQLDDDLYWIRDEFIQNMHYFKKTVVFGHTPFEDVLFHLPYKIGIDTGLVYGNALSCIEVTGEQVFQIVTGETEVYQATWDEKGGKWPQFG